MGEDEDQVEFDRLCRFLTGLVLNSCRHEEAEQLTNAMICSTIDVAVATYKMSEKNTIKYLIRMLEDMLVDADDEPPVIRS